MSYQRERITVDDVQSVCENIAENRGVDHIHREITGREYTAAIRYGDFGQKDHLGQTKEVWCIDTTDPFTDTFYSDDIFVVIEYVRAYVNQEPLRYGAVVVFPPNYTRQQSEDAISEIYKHIDRNYYVAGQSIERTLVTAFDGRDGGPVWYIP